MMDVRGHRHPRHATNEAHHFHFETGARPSKTSGEDARRPRTSPRNPPHCPAVPRVSRSLPGQPSRQSVRGKSLGLEKIRIIASGPWQSTEPRSF
ncbi:hypothetical protein P170DRAFT_77420 [Aspergillus steynii IBT 23096]|uniref:Uncharacterized protein n=1 Tax=Aspergillus steynii IBT 23096 TaxID=1392250 RepID=A0A2I2FS40_9EURO|nr:uncharacterized protein P170DRAFT_77420 [Aspergillus steynii IBT 23096]PLB43441.1 hypothetical protein P170DRAFT_77420 [Aspergillus steynii IBT 23096]